MSEEEQHGDGVFGNLPRTRPGTRSPLRQGGADGTPGEPERSGGAKGAPSPDSPSDPPPTRREHARPGPEPPAAAGERSRVGAPGVGRPEDPQPAAQPASLEDLAWAGIAVAAEVANVALQMVNRAMKAAQDAADRR